MDNQVHNAIVNFIWGIADDCLRDGLEEYNLKLLDKYVWLLGKEYFPKNYGKKG